jgi:hypothetical protein
MALYTNRAQAFIKIGKYAEALSDCDWALRVYAAFFYILTVKSRKTTFYSPNYQSIQKMFFHLHILSIYLDSKVAFVFLVDTLENATITEISKKSCFTRFCSF